jgi:hypothetical protein
MGDMVQLELPVVWLLLGGAYAAVSVGVFSTLLLFKGLERWGRRKPRRWYLPKRV